MAVNEPTIATILRTLADQYTGPVQERLIYEQVLQQRPSNAKNPFATIRERLRWDGLALGWIRLKRGELIPLRVVLQDLRFRCIPASAEVAAGYVSQTHLFPFVGMHTESFQFEDENGIPLAIQYHTMSTAYHPILDLGSWYRLNEFTARDSILCTIVKTKPLTIRIVREPTHRFEDQRVVPQDHELIDAILKEMSLIQRPLVPCDELVLSIFARSTWRTSYPGTPWQHLVNRHPSLELIDSVFLTTTLNDHLLRSPEHMRSEEDALRTEIFTLQDEIANSRAHDVATGIWSGQIERASLGHDRYQEEEPWDDDLFGSLSDASDFDELLDDAWEGPWHDDLIPEDALIGAEALTSEAYDLDEASRRLLAALPPEAAEQLQTARPEEAELIIAAHLNLLLVREPSLFVPLVTSPEAVNYDGVKSPDGETILDILTYTASETDEAWELWDDEEEEHAHSIYSRSSELMALFYVHLVETGKSITTARTRAHGLWIYADFLASYYQRSLAEGDYATLDECLFFFYPRKLISRSPRQLRELSTSLKQFYSFLKQQGTLTDERFAEAIWRRRDQAARVLTLYQRLDRALPNFEQLYAQLFAPYISMPGAGR